MRWNAVCNLPRWKTVPTDDGLGTKTVRVGLYAVEYEVAINEPGLVELAGRAFRNKGRKSHDGPVTVKILRSTEEG